MKLFKHTSYNLLGLGLPLLAAVFTIPVLITELGTARFGLLTLIWAVVGYFGLFDLGLGRALTLQLAVVLSKKEPLRIGPLVGTATIMMTALGLFAGFLMAAIAAWGVGLINAVPDQNEAIYAVYAMALAMPFIILTSGFRGILEAYHAFGVINLIRLPMGLLTFVGPLVVVLYWQPRLDLIAAVLCVGRLVACAVHGYYAWRALPKQHGHIRWEPQFLKPLCISGGWMTVSNVISPLMGYVDRFAIGSILSAVAVAYYVIPQEIATKLWFIPGALTAVLFPAIARQISHTGQKTTEMIIKALLTLAAVMLPICMMFALFSHEVLEIWVGKAIADQGYYLLKIFSLGVFLNSIATIPFTLLQSAGHAKTTAIIHAAQLPFFLLILWMLTSNFGLTGAGVAWLIRIIFDFMLMFLYGFRILGNLSILKNRTTLFLTASLLTLTGAVLLPHVFQLFLALIAMSLCASMLFAIKRMQQISTNQ